MEQLINITDAVFLGHVGEIELGASALASIYYLAIYMLGFGFSLGLQVMVARRNGELHYEDTGRTFIQGLFFLVILSMCLCGLSQWASPHILKYFIQSADIYHSAVDYIYWRSWGLLFSFPFLAFRAFYVGIIRTKVLSWAALIAVLINIPCNYLFIFSLEWGISGAALASSLSEAASFIMMLFYTLYYMDKNRYGLKIKYNGRLLKKLLQLSVWSVMHSFISMVPWFLFFVAIERLGETSLAASNITRSVSTVFFVLVSSFAATTGSLVSNLIGAGEGKLIFSVSNKVLKLGYGVGLPLVVLAMLFARPIIGFYTDSAMLVEVTYIPFFVMLVNYVFGLPGYVYISMVTGTGNTRLAFIFQVVTIIVYLGYLYVLSCCFTMPLAVYLTAEYVFVILLGVQSYVYLKRYVGSTGRPHGNKSKLETTK